MKIYLAGGESHYRSLICKTINELKTRGLTVNVLWSYYSYTQRGGEATCNADNFLLDSGAFTFLSSGKHIDWNEYVSRYIEYIKANNVKLFFELDIDKIIGYDRVKEIRRRLERETGKRPIPVWHKHLGKEEFLRMCDEFDYIAIGGFAIKDINVSEYKYLPAFLREAHKRGTKVHGLGFSHSAWLPKLHFDSVDSTSWTYGLRCGQIYFFDRQAGCMKYTKMPKGYRARVDLVPMHNFTEWVKFSNWAETHL